MNPKNAPYGWLVKRIAHRLEQNMNNFLKPYNITIMQSWVLLYLKDDKDCCTYKELEREFEVSQPTMAGIISRLEQKELVITSQNDKDKRIKKVRISDKGLDLIILVCDHLQESEDDIIRGFFDKEQETFHSLLERAYYNVVERGDEND